MAQSKEAKNAYMREYNAANREKLREKARERYKNHPTYRGVMRRASEVYTQTVKGRAKQLLTSARLRAEAAGLEFTITETWVAERLEHGVCPMTGLRFVMERGEGRQPYAPSLDRIDPKTGYTPDNARLIISAANLAKNVWSDDVLLTWARALVNQHDSAH